MIKVTIKDSHIFRSITTSTLISYLELHKWNLVGSYGGGLGSMFTLDSADGKFEIIVPLDSTFRDYHLRIGEIFHILEIVENRSQLDILKDILSQSLVTFTDAPGQPSDAPNCILTDDEIEAWILNRFGPNSLVNRQAFKDILNLQIEKIRKSCVNG